MKNKLFATLALAFFAGISIPAPAHDFEVAMSRGNVYYVNILDTLLRTAELTYAGAYSRPDSIRAEGVVFVPETVSHNGKEYRIVRIGTKAFCAGDKIESLILPSSIRTIGEFAFEGCTSLKSIVFPGSQVNIYDGAFWNCSNIEEISFGSDWTEVNLEHFKWSTALRSIMVPAKVRTILHLRAVKSLENVNVDPNNSAFSSLDGILYSGNRSILYTCPVAHKSDVVVPEGTKSILRGAFLECGFVKSVELPASLETLSFVEFAPLTSLETLTMKRSTPCATATADGREVFALKLAPSARVYVPKMLLEAYTGAICSSAGKYRSLDGKDEVECRDGELLNAKKIAKTK